MKDHLQFLSMTLLVTLLLLTGAFLVECVQVEDQATEIQSLKTELQTVRGNLDICLGDFKQ